MNAPGATPPQTLSVVIPNYNHARFFPLLVKSVLEQSFPPREVIMLDDASTDNSVEMMEQLAASHPTFRFYRNERNMGAVASFNKVYKLATSEYVFCPAADDLVYPGFFAKSMALLAAHPEAGLCSSNVVLIDEEGREVAVRSKPVIARHDRYFSPEELKRVISAYGPWIDCGSIIARRACMAAQGYFLEELGSYSDTFIAHVIAVRWGACFVPEVLSCWRRMPTGFSSKSGLDWKALLNKGRLSARMMRTQHRELFPPAFIERFEQRWLYMVGATSAARILHRAEQELGEVIEDLWLKPSFARRLFCACTHFLLNLVGALWRMTLAARFGPWGWWLRGRVSIVLNLRSRRFWEKVRARN